MVRAKAAAISYTVKKLAPVVYFKRLAAHTHTHTHKAMQIIAIAAQHWDKCVPLEHSSLDRDCETLSFTTA